MFSFFYSRKDRNKSPWWLSGGWARVELGGMLMRRRQSQGRADRGHSWNRVLRMERPPTERGIWSLLPHSHSPKCFGKNGCCRVYPLEPLKRRKPGGGSLRRMSSESSNWKTTFRGRWFPAQGPLVVVLWCSDHICPLEGASQIFRITFQSTLIPFKLFQVTQSYYSEY